MAVPPSSISELVALVFAALPSTGSVEAPRNFRCVARAASPRWIFPADRIVASVLGSWSPYKFSSRVGWKALQAAQAAGVEVLLPGVTSATLESLPVVDWRHVGWKHNAAPVPVIYVGTPGPRQKAVIHLIDSNSGYCEAVLKVPLRPKAHHAISHESDVLAVMEDEFFTAAPSLLFSDRPRGISTQEFLPGISGSRHFLPEYQSVLHSLLLPDEHTTLAGQAAGWQNHPLWGTLDNLHLTTLAAALAEQSETTPVPACWVHGDFAPWNIRQASGRAPRLIDWETGKRAGLPLQDAFHFLHAQQFLFHRRPRSFTAAVEPLSGRMGISPLFCRKLEMAYLGRSYFASLACENPRRAEFLFQTLSLVLREHRRCVSTSPVSRLRLVSSRPARQMAARTEMLTFFTAELRRQDVPYCILSGYETAAAASGSDVDVMFRPADLHRVPSVLARAARSAGAQIVQEIAHETSARYFVLARAEGKHVTHLAVDAYGDYRRDSRTWLSAKALVARRRSHRDFFRPAIADEFIYRLMKKVLKQSFTPAQLKQLLHLFARDSTECQNRLAQFWPTSLATRIECALLRQNREWLMENLPELRASLLKSHPVEATLARGSGAVLEVVRLFQRVLRPTGFVVRISSEHGALSAELADRLMCNLAPAFRRVEVTPAAVTGRRSVKAGWQRWRARVRSTLVIETEDKVSACEGRRWFGRPDLILRLQSEAPPARERTRAWDAAHVVAFDTDDFPDELVRKATATLLNHLADRLKRRLKLPGAGVPQRPFLRDIGAPDIEFESVGLD